MARLIDVPVSIPIWQEFCTEGWECGFDGFGMRCVEGLPEGAELVNSYYEGNPPTVHLEFHHPSFENIPIGSELPILVLSYRRIKVKVGE